MERQPRLTKSLGAPSTGHWGRCCQLSAPPPCPLPLLPLPTTTSCQLPDIFLSASTLVTSSEKLASNRLPPPAPGTRISHQNLSLLQMDAGESRDRSRQVAVSNHDPCPGPSLQGQEMRNRQDMILQNTNWSGRACPRAAAHLTGHRAHHCWVPGPGSTHCPQSHGRGGDRETDGQGDHRSSN